ncbi:MAG: hypothetical protein JO033_24870 [Acidobacteriaceae bacterium]|nr:hypothetical protein [Acidobacteriaceae bacterium]
MPQQIGQISPPTAGHARFGRRLPHILQSVDSFIQLPSQQMQRIDLYIKVTVDLEEEEKLERVAGEICRQIEKIYVVRSAELSSSVVRE